jgi:hypothetical protein
MNPEAEALALVTREKRNHVKDSKNKHEADERQARIRRKSMIQEEQDEDDWKAYVDR